MAQSNYDEHHKLLTSHSVFTWPLNSLPTCHSVLVGPSHVIACKFRQTYRALAQHRVSLAAHVVEKSYWYKNNRWRCHTTVTMVYRYLSIINICAKASKWIQFNLILHSYLATLINNSFARKPYMALECSRKWQS